MPRTGSVSRAVGAVVMLVSLGAAGQAQKPTLVPAPVGLQANPALKRYETEVRGLFFETLRDCGGVLTPTRPETEAAFVAGNRQDCRESNECMTKLAVRAGVLYALFVEVSYAQQKALVMSGRVVRDDGKVMSSATVREEKKQDTIVEVSKRLFIELYAQLGLAALPTFKETAPEVKDPLKEPVKDSVLIDLPPPPPPPVVDSGAGQRSAGTGLLYAGAAVAVAGGVLAGVGGGLGYGLRLEQQEVPASRLPAINTARALTGAGLAGVGLGAVTAVVGAIVLGTAAPAPVARISVVPMVGGGVVQLGGRF